MPEYLAPGVYVEEVSFRAKSIEGVSTTTTGFVGPRRYGPLDIEPDIITSIGEFERVYGDGQPLAYVGGGRPVPNYLWHAARAFVTEWGKRLYVVRVYRPAAAAGPSPGVPAGVANGRVSAPNLPPPADTTVPIERQFKDAIHVRARFPGAAGNVRVRFTLRVGPNLLRSEVVRTAAGEVRRNRVSGLQANDVVLITDRSAPISSPPGPGTLYTAATVVDAATNQADWTFKHATTAVPTPDVVLNSSVANDPQRLVVDVNDPDKSDEVRLVTLTVSVLGPLDDDLPRVWSDLPLDPAHETNGAPDSFAAVFSPEPANRSRARTLPIVITLGENVAGGDDVWATLFAASSTLEAQLRDRKSTDDERSVEVALAGGTDGLPPGLTEYEGQADDASSIKTGLRAMEDIEDVSIIAAPGCTAGFGASPAAGDAAMSVLRAVIAHAEFMRYRIAVLDSGDGQTVADVRAMRAKLDSKYAALYYPWVRVLDPITREEIDLPPSGFVAGIYARNDIERAVYKAPANEVVRLALGFETLLNKAQQDVLNPEGVNCFRFFEGRGFRLWGARTISSDPEWKYVNLRRYFAYLERSIDRGTQWAVFEPNGERLWANVRRTVEDFLFNEFQSGALLGTKPEQAYFVKCDRSTMTQNDLDNGRLICLIGVAPLRPAEFVIFRIGQFTADAKL